MKILIACVLSAALIWLHPQHTPVHLNNSAVKVQKTTTATVKVNETVQNLQAPNPQPKTTAVPVQQTSVAKVTPTYPSSCAAYEPLVAEYNWDVRVAMAIMQAESSCNPYAVSNASINYDGVPDYGLFQIHGEDILTPSANVARAYQKYQSQGWQAWSTYNTGKIWQYYQ